MERKEYKIFLPSDEQAGQLIDVAWKDFYEKAEAAGLGIVHDGVRSIMRDFFVSGYTYGYNDVLNIIRDHMAAEELAKSVQEDAEVSEKDTKLYELGFSTRVLTCLRSAGIETLGDLLRVWPASLLKIKNFGKKSMKEIREFYEKHGYESGSESLEYLGSGRYYLPKKGERI